MLHIIGTRFEHDVLFERMGQGEGNALLFVASAVLCLHKKSQAAKLILAHSRSFQCYVLQADLLARGLTSADMIPEITVVDYQGFVTLTVEHKVIKTWN